MTEEPENKVQDKSEKKIPVMEIFGPTIQGEGITIGQRTLFVRFGLCDYKCAKCDSMHAVDPKSVKANARWLTQQDIFMEVLELCKNNNCAWVTLSGGNPAIHDLTDLMRAFVGAGIGVNVETQGTLAPAWLGAADYITCSPKSPGMGERFEASVYQRFIHKFKAHTGLTTKVVIFSAQDLEFASMVAEMSDTIVASDCFYLSLGNPNPPVLGAEEPVEADTQALIETYLEMIEEIKEYPALKQARWLPQLHVLLWGNRAGV